MKTRTDVLNSLGELNSADRQWIVDRLSPVARRTLLDEQSGKSLQPVKPVQDALLSRATPSAPTELETAVRVIEASTVESLVAAVASEPAWVVHAMLAFRDWSWRAEFLRALPARVRNELSQLDLCGVRYASKTSELLLAGLAPQIANATVHGGVSVETPAAGSRFEKLLHGFGTALARNKARMQQ